MYLCESCAKFGFNYVPVNLEFMVWALSNPPSHHLLAPIADTHPWVVPNGYTFYQGMDNSGSYIYGQRMFTGQTPYYAYQAMLSYLPNSALNFTLTYLDFVYDLRPVSQELGTNADPQVSTPTDFDLASFMYPSTGTYFFHSKGEACVLHLREYLNPPAKLQMQRSQTCSHQPTLQNSCHYDINILCSVVVLISSVSIHVRVDFHKA